MGRGRRLSLVGHGLTVAWVLQIHPPCPGKQDAPLGRVSEDAWRDEVLAWLCTGNGYAFGEESVAGVDVFAITCGSTASAALIFTDNRGYLIRLVVSSDDPGLAETYDWDWHKRMLKTVDLRPEDALDAPSPSESP